MAVAVIEHLEMIDIHNQKGQGLCRILCLLHAFHEPDIKILAVGDAGQRICQGFAAHVLQILPQNINLATGFG